MTLKALLINLETIRAGMSEEIRSQLKLSKEFGELTSYYRDVPYAERGLFPNSAIMMRSDSKECTVQEFIDRAYQFLQEHRYSSEASILIDGRSILALKECGLKITLITTNIDLETFIKDSIKQNKNWMKIFYENEIFSIEFPAMSSDYSNDYIEYLNTIRTSLRLIVHANKIAGDKIRKNMFIEAVNDVMPKNLEEDDFCEWIKYDYRTICPKYHDADNPYWRIPENMDKLKYCPYCGKEIKVAE